MSGLRGLERLVKAKAKRMEIWSSLSSTSTFSTRLDNTMILSSAFQDTLARLYSTKVMASEMKYSFNMAAADILSFCTESAGTCSRLHRQRQTVSFLSKWLQLLANPLQNQFSSAVHFLLYTFCCTQQLEGLEYSLRATTNTSWHNPGMSSGIDNRSLQGVGMV